MLFHFRPMTQSSALEIADHWHYEGIYAFYDAQADEEDYHELISRESRKNHYFEAVNPNGDLVGFYAINEEGETIEIGLGLRPDCCGKGWGRTFLSQLEQNILSNHHPQKFVMAVASFNIRAIKVYESCAYRVQAKETRIINRQPYEFLVLEKAL